MEACFLNTFIHWCIFKVNRPEKELPDNGVNSFFLFNGTAWPTSRPNQAIT